MDSLSIHHVQITVPHAAEDAAKHFYATVLGFREIPKPAPLRANGGAWYQVGPLELHVSPDDAANDRPRGKAHICYVVPDLEQTERRLRDLGQEIIDDRQPIPNWRRFYLHDPGGNRIEIAQLNAPA